jgi:hypothetical protein
VDHPADPGALTCGKQGGGTIPVHGFNGLATPVLQYAGSVHDRIDVREKRQPVLRILHPGDVDADMRDAGLAEAPRPMRRGND